jgi:UDP-2,4-diacetamido-2,4,6-trideoxy-beta-L-altropyranose hydrolase
MNLTRKKIYFRADGNSKIGLGHIYRVYSLIQILNYYFNCIFITKYNEKSLLDKFSQIASIEIISAFSSVNEEIDYINSLVQKDEILVIDGYDFNLEYQKKVKINDNKLICIEDELRTDTMADIIINYSYNKQFESESKDKPKYLLGFKYVILRQAFYELPYSRLLASKLDTVFLCLGGGDSNNLTFRTLKILFATETFKKIIIVTGSAFPYTNEIENLVQSTNSCCLEHYNNIETEQLINLLKLSDLAIVPSSTIALEACCTLTPIITGMTADNQKNIHEELLKKKCVISINNFYDVDQVKMNRALEKISDYAVRQAMVENQRLCFDGFASERILNEFLLIS